MKTISTETLSSQRQQRRFRLNFYRMDTYWRCWSENPDILVGPETKTKLQLAKLKGLTFESVYGRMKVVPAAGVEPATFRSGGERSNPLSYAGLNKIAGFKEMNQECPPFCNPFCTPRQYWTFSRGAQIEATKGFSKKWENLKAAYALHFAHYSFCRIHSSIK